METVQGNHNQHGINGDCSNHVFSTERIKEDDLFGELKVLPRVGDQYQADLPALVTEIDQKIPVHKNCMDINPIKLSVGLPLSLMWVANKFEVRHESAESPSNSIGRSVSEESLKSEDCNLKVERVDVSSDVSMALTESINLPLESEVKVQKHRGHYNYLVPGLLDDTWNDTEQESFVLGLYIFGKNLVQLQQFIESKRMGDVLSFYYGKFYKSKSYCRWSKCRKTRSRKCIYGQKIFTGPRQQELLARLSSHVSDECHSTLLQVTKTFREGKMSLEEYVFYLKTTVGLKALISAVGIGKGKEDLTGITVESPKSDQAISFHTEIPFRKACSDLTPSEITKFLSGNYRLSKARSSDLFWEAVWPRLLAKGWHSEQPSDHFYAAGSHSLVFIIPGVKKFSRRKLLKGKHYFDSVTDVLLKVASDPGLLELETGAEVENMKEEDGHCSKNKLQNHESSNPQSHCYIKPCSPKHVADFMKFTVVDTSLADGGKFKVRELRSLPVEMNSCHSQCSSEETEGISCQVSQSTDESDSANSVLSNKGHSNYSGVFPDTSAAKTDSSRINVILYEGKSRMGVNAQPRKAKKDQTNKRKRPTEKVQAAITAKQPCRSISCSRVDTVYNCCQGNLDLHSILVSSQELPKEKKLASIVSCGGSSPISSEVIVSGNFATVNAEPQTPIDLNLYGHTNAQTDQSSMTDMLERERDLPTASANDAIELKLPVVPSSSKLLPDTAARRHSTRNRPLTLKALEALACGFLTTTVKGKRRGSTPSKPASRPSVHAKNEKQRLRW